MTEPYLPEFEAERQWLLAEIANDAARSRRLDWTWTGIGVALWAALLAALPVLGDSVPWWVGVLIGAALGAPIVVGARYAAQRRCLLMMAGWIERATVEDIFEAGGDR